MNSSIFTCKGCQERYPGCHAKCEKYASERAEYDKRKSLMEKKREAEIYQRDLIYRRKNDAAKRKKTSLRWEHD